VSQDLAVEITSVASATIPLRVRRAAATYRKHRARYYENLAGKLKAGRGNIKLLDIFERDAQRYPGEPLGILSAHWADLYSGNGANLAEAWQGTFPDDEVSIIRIAADAGGDGALLTALQDVSRIAKLTDKVKSAVIGTLAAAIVGITVALLMATVFPLVAAAKFLEIYGFIPLDQWGPKGKAFVDHAERVKSYGLYFIGAAVTVFMYVQWTINNLVGPAREWLDQKVILYRVIRDIKGALFLSTMATLTRKRGNVMFTMRQSLETFVSSVRSNWLRWRVQQVIDGIDATGGVGSDALNTNLLSKEMFYFLRDTQEANGFAEGFEETGKYVESTVMDDVLFKMTVYRWVLLLTGVATVLAVFGWQFSVIYEMKGVMQTYFTSK
jgi:type II secretory pathway component PulF